MVDAVNEKARRLITNGTDTSFYQYDQDIGFWGIPDMEREVLFEHLGPDYILVRHNAEGNRDNPFQKCDDRETLLCIGGSHTWGAAVKQELIYPPLLMGITGRRVVNLGHCSLGLDQICIAIMKKAEAYSPSIIIVEQYPWAIHRVLNPYVSGYTRPYFTMDEKGSLKLQKIPRSSRFKVCRRIIGSFYTYRKEFREFKAGINLRNGYDPWADPIFLSWKMPYYDYMYNLVDRILAVMQDFCRQKGIRLLFGLTPIMQQFGPKSPSALIDYTLPLKRLMSILENNRIAHIDASTAMMAEHSVEEPVIFKDGHMNEKGHRIFAQELARGMEERQWLSA